MILLSIHFPLLLKLPHITSSLFLLQSSLIHAACQHHRARAAYKHWVVPLSKLAEVSESEESFCSFREGVLKREQVNGFSQTQVQTYENFL